MEEKLEFSTLQTKAIEAAEKGRNIFLTGGAGVGKSAVVKEIIRRMEAKGKRVVVLAPTGKAAINVGGETIHRFFRLQTSPQVADLYEGAKNLDYTIRAKLQNVDLVIIDEISMVRRDVFDVISAMMLNARFDLQLMVVGDFQQLPPVMVDRGEGSDKEILEQHYKTIGEEWYDGAYAFHSKAWLDWDFELILLSKVFRQSDVKFIKALNLIAQGDPQGKACRWIQSHSAQNEIKDCTWICSTNRDADNLNAENMDKLPGEKYIFEAEISGDEGCFKKESDCPVPKTLELRIGALVMTRINDPMGRFVNGSVGKVVSINDSHTKISVKFDDGVVEIPKSTWNDNEYKIVDKKLETRSKGSFVQFPVILAYAITVHKSQGATLEKANVRPMCFENGQLYTMLSRVKGVEGIYIHGTLAKKYCKSNKDVVDLYSAMREANRVDDKIKFAVKIPKEKEAPIKALIRRYLTDEVFARNIEALMG